jgi:hypothetical protein
MNLHQIQTEGSGHRLGPVVVTKTFPSKPGDTSVFLLVKDDSGQGALKIWGCPFGQAPAVGQSISLVTDGGPKSSITNKEYPVGSGKFSINASGCQILRDGAPAPSHDASPAAQSNTPSFSSIKVDQKEVDAAIGATAAGVTSAYFNSLLEHGFTREEAIQLSAGASNLKPLYWGGEKFLS